MLIDAEQGQFFVKGIENRAGGRRDSIIRERLINESVQPLSPRLLWHVESDQWIALGFERVSGRLSDLAPGSADLPAVIELLDRIGDVSLPAVADRWPERRWNRFASDADEAALFRGHSLIHGDINPSNFLVGDGGSWVVDWAWPTRGSALIDPALLVLQLIAGGHSPAGAESWVAGCAGWSTSAPAAIDAFAMANLRMFRTRARRFPEQEWLGAMEETARAWVAHRLG
ncbi:protein kinase [Streptomyces sp. NPDC055189]